MEMCKDCKSKYDDHNGVIVVTELCPNCRNNLVTDISGQLEGKDDQYEVINLTNVVGGN